MYACMHVCMYTYMYTSTYTDIPMSMAIRVPTPTAANAMAACLGQPFCSSSDLSLASWTGGHQRQHNFSYVPLKPRELSGSFKRTDSATLKELGVVYAAGAPASLSP